MAPGGENAPPLKCATALQAVFVRIDFFDLISEYLPK